jgi:hypothetical protein
MWREKMSNVESIVKNEDFMKKATFILNAFAEMDPVEQMRVLCMLSQFACDTVREMSGEVIE